VESVADEASLIQRIMVRLKSLNSCDKIATPVQARIRAQSNCFADKLSNGVSDILARTETESSTGHPAPARNLDCRSR
jgi:hypothetical protein